MTDEATIPSTSTDKLAETVKVDSLNEPSCQLLPSLDDSVPQLNPHTLTTSAKIEERCDVKPMCGSVKFGIPSELHLDPGWVFYIYLKHTSASEFFLFSDIGMGDSACMFACRCFFLKNVSLLPQSD